MTCAFKHGLEMKAIIEDENADDGVKLRVNLFLIFKKTFKFTKVHILFNLFHKYLIYSIL